MSELERFKKEINLTEFAASRGYVLDARESSRNSAVMRHPDGDKVIIAKGESGDWVFFSVRDDRDNGSIIDFLQWRGGGNLGDIRKTLREWTGSARPAVPAETFAPDLLPVSRDRAAILRAWERSRPVVALPYLAARGIGADVLGLPAFAGCVRRDPRGNAIFPHYDRGGLCGFEIKNQGFTGFSAGGIKGLWFSSAGPAARRLVICESAIDALSYFILHRDEGEEMRLVSTGGEMNPNQPALIRAAMEKMPPGSVVVLAFDNDEGGQNLAGEVWDLAPASVTIRRPLPPVGAKDWNDALREAKGLELPPITAAPAGPDLDYFGARSPRLAAGGAASFRSKKGYAPKSPKNAR